MSPGDIVAGRFEIESAAGKGGMAMVYKARDRETGDRVALKVMRGIGALVPERFAREADVLAELRHPGIVRYVAHGQVEHAAYIAMEWLDGEDLSRRLARAPLSLDETVGLVACTMQALAAAHARGVVHRDIKPSNLFLSRGNVRDAKLLDFGIARFEANPEITATGVVLGTPGYMAPEQVRGSKNIDSSADLFALGCVLYRCLIGRPPFVAENMVGVLAKILLEDPQRLGELRDGIPEALEDLAFRMLAKDPRARPDDATVIAGLERIEKHAGPVASSTRADDRTALGGGEQRVCSVVLVGRLPDAMDGPTIVDLEPTTGVSDESIAPIEALRSIVASHGGRLEALVDGSLLAIIEGGAREMASHAARCALAIRARMPGNPMALATGRAEARGRLPIGDVVDRAASLLENASGEGVRVDDATVGLLDVRFGVTGDAHGLELRSERSPIEEPRTLLGRRTPCVGREHEIATLQQMFEECVARRSPHGMLVTGPAGIGKSRIVHEIVPRIARSGALVWIGRGDMITQGSMLGLIAPSLQRAAGVQEGEPLDVRRRKVAARIARNVPGSMQARVTAFLGELIGTPFPDGHTPELRSARGDFVLLGDHIRRAWIDFLDAELDAQPVVLVLENLQWGDVASINLVDLAFRNIRAKPFCVIAAARPDVREAFPNLWEGRGIDEMRLEELGANASKQLVRTILGDSPSGDLVSRMVERAAGNAFYLEEIIRAVAAGRGADALPDTVFAMVQARLDVIDGELRRVLRAASLFGQTFWAGGVAALLGAKSVDAELSELERLEIVHVGAEGKFPHEHDWGFRHAIVRDAAYAMLTETDRALGHRLAAEWLERVGEREPIVLAEHWESGGADARAIDWYVAAAEQALGGNDFAGAVERAERGVRCGAKGARLGALRLVQADAHRWRSEYAKMKECAEAAMEVLPPNSDAWYTALAQIAVATGSLGNVTALVAATEPLFEETPASSAQVAAWDRVAAHFATAGRLDLAEPLWDTLDSVADRFDSPWIHRARAFRGLFKGDPAMYAHHSTAAADAFARAGDLRNACQQRCNAGDAIKELGDHPAAEAALRMALVDADRMGLTYVTTNGKLNLAVVLIRMGDGKGAVELATAAATEGKGQHHPRFEGAARTYLAMAHQCAGDLAKALRVAKGAAEFIRASVPPWLPFALAVQASIELALGDANAALASAREAMDRLNALGTVEEGEALVRLMIAEALDRTGDPAGARTAILDAKKALLARAQRITDARYRKTFLENIGEHARTLELARLWE